MYFIASRAPSELQRYSSGQRPGSDITADPLISSHHCFPWSHLRVQPQNPDGPFPFCVAGCCVRSPTRASRIVGNSGQNAALVVFHTALYLLCSHVAGEAESQSMGLSHPSALTQSGPQIVQSVRSIAPISAK